MTRVRIAVVGVGKIARDAHVPTLATSDQFELVGAVSQHRAAIEGVPTFATISAMAASGVGVEAVSICTPPRGRLALVAEALSHGLHVMIEKPPAATVSEAGRFLPMARTAGRSLYATWHSREAAAVAPARDWLKGKTITRVAVSWKEDVRVWHPGQEWIWEPGIGVFDPGINALSVLTAILPEPLRLVDSELRFPSNRSAPIAADLVFAHGPAAQVNVAFDFDQRGPQTWDIEVETDAGQLVLSMGGSRMAVDGRAVDVGDEPEYRRLYRRFGDLIAQGESDVDLAPFHHVADAFLLARRVTVAAFEWDG